VILLLLASIKCSLSSPYGNVSLITAWYVFSFVLMEHFVLAKNVPSLLQVLIGAPNILCISICAYWKVSVAPYIYGILFFIHYCSVQHMSFVICVHADRRAPAPVQSQSVFRCVSFDFL